MPGAAGDRLATWHASLSASADPARLDQRLRFLGWSAAQAGERLSAGGDPLQGLFDDAPAGVDAARGAALLEQGLRFFEQHGPVPAAQQGLPFETMLAALACPAIAGLPSFDPPVTAQLGQALCARLRDVAEAALLAQPPAPESAWQAGGLRRCLARLPLLGAAIGGCLRQWQQAVAELAARLEADRLALAQAFNAGRPPGAVTGIALALGDRHDDGRSVAGIRFACGLRLVYKPRSLAMDVAWAGLLEWLGAQDARCSLRAAHALDCGSHGWTEHISPAPLVDHGAAQAYHRSAGALLAAAWLCGGSDLHDENLIASAQGPVLVDLETLFTPAVRPFFPGAAAPRGRNAGEAAAHSMLDTLLLPQPRGSRGPALDISGLAGSQAGLPNLPRGAAGQAIAPAAWAADLVAGFRHTARLLLQRREALLAESGPLQAFRRLRLRFLLRPTQAYADLARQLRQSALLAHAVDRDIALERLARGYLPPDAGQEAPQAMRLCASERLALARGDVPLFHTSTGSTALQGDGGIRVDKHFWHSGWDRVALRLRLLNAAQIEAQAQLAITSLLSNQ